MEERTMNTAGGMTMPNNIAAQSAAAAQSRTNTEMPKISAKPVSASIPNNANMAAGTANTAKPPAMPKAETMPLMRMPNTGNMPETGNKESKPNEQEMTGQGGNSYKKGELPHYAPLAAGYVPYQQNNSPKYAHTDALTHGTLFPGLDLPFMNAANKNNPYAGTPLGEVMALDFAVHELSLYLDTHEDDKEAFEMLKSLLKLSGEGRRKYEQLYGPIDLKDLEKASKYTWLRDPWPWEYTERMVSK